MLTLSPLMANRTEVDCSANMQHGCATCSLATYKCYFFSSCNIYFKSTSTLKICTLNMMCDPIIEIK